MGDRASDRSSGDRDLSDRPIWTPFHTQLHRTLKQRQLLEPNQRVLIAVSGGQDSVCLLLLLRDLQPKWNWELAIAHCDHRWPGDEGNAQFVAALAETWNIPYFLQVAEEIDRREAAARTWRYAALTEMAQQHGYTRIATGHTLSDRAETLLYNLVRGSGADGLQALTWRRSLTDETQNAIQLVRPLLNFSRADTAQVCRSRGMQVWQDGTNQDLRYVRPRIRHVLLPYLQAHLNPQAEQALAQTAELLQADVEYLEQTAAHLLQQVQHPERPGLDRQTLRSLPLALQRRVVRQFLQIQLPHAPNFEQIEKVVALIAAPNRTQTDPLPGGTIAQVEGHWIWLTG